MLYHSTAGGWTGMVGTHPALVDIPPAVRHVSRPHHYQQRGGLVRGEAGPQQAARPTSKRQDIVTCITVEPPTHNPCQTLFKAVMPVKSGSPRVTHHQSHSSL